jgi:hypothetical protein
MASSLGHLPVSSSLSSPSSSPSPNYFSNLFRFLSVSLSFFAFTASPAVWFFALLLMSSGSGRSEAQT